ncbi:G-type lectin S-receptor-like serine/threonine-protein kinase RLK1 [Morus notabilis]|uniref:Receptor-like serine/threonine-protein kinase n=1 Tax=Morus notabilis TaxID=981085 RepID=W9QD80_9ROSA|nr:G-type lectin S-receptor-like serine/threonine-protein kinase LECRK3 [Morus notabilis]EXB28979.1 G-type lectin S-receptor-like serine/threonine-protein kinase RLK1 [Morus notabilis]
MALAPPYHILCFLISFLTLLCFSTAQTQRNISLGSSLTAVNNDNSSWESLSGDFAFGFLKIGKEGFLIAIWFNKIAEKTVVWSANGNNLVQQGSKVELTNLGLILRDPKGNQKWSSGISGTGVAYGDMLDTGNFVVANQNSSNLWESFDNPTDTLLPSQTLSLNMKLVARYSEANYSRGRFMFVLQLNGSLELFTRAFPRDDANAKSHWNSGTEGSGFQVMFNQSGSIYVAAKNGTVLNTLVSQSASTEKFYKRAILEYDGVFRQYVYPKSNSKGWNMAWSPSSTSIPSNICTISEEIGGGACGFNSYCSLGNDQRRYCSCPDGYTFIDPNDEMGGCKATFEAQSCDEGLGDADHFDFYSMDHTNWPFSDYEHFQSVSEDWCRKACLSDCFCALAIFNDGGGCWKKRNPFSNGVMDYSVGAKALIKIRKDNSTSKLGSRDSKKKDYWTLVLIESVLLSVSAFVNVLLLAAFVVLFHIRRKKSKVTTPNQFKPAMNLQSFTYAELEKATDGFKEQLGSGAYGTVFKGALTLDKKTLVAAKKLNNMMQEGEKEFEAEVVAIGRTNHKNLVQLIGFCNEGQHRILVYEFMSNGSLGNFLFGSSKPSWYQRMQIALGIARGLFYLHEECRMQIIHCDIKPQNILLDDSYTARISDFGLAKILKINQTRTMTGIRGTKGYVAAEWFRNMAVTVKVDVYSYGILLLELICCRRNFEHEIEDATQMILADWAYDCYACRKLDFLVEDDDEAMEDLKMVEKYVMVAIWCIQEDPSLRPSMKKVVQMLEGTVEVSVPPNPTSSISSL